jgi:hypothetical protein
LAIVDLSREALLLVLDDGEVGMSDPGVNQLFVELTRFFQRLISCLIILSSVEFFSTFSGSHHVNDSFVSSVAELHG